MKAKAVSLLIDNVHVLYINRFSPRIVMSTLLSQRVAKSINVTTVATQDAVRLTKHQKHQLTEEKEVEVEEPPLHSSSKGDIVNDIRN